MNFDKWSIDKYKNFIKYLKSLKDENYKKFNSKLIPNIDKNKIIGIRIPALRKISNEIYKSDYEEFLKLVKNNYFEETMIEGLVIAQIKNKNKFEDYVKKFVPKIDNWAICDTFCNSIKIINSDKDYFFNFFKDFLKSNHEYIIRCGLVVFLNFYIDKNYIEEIFTLIDEIKSEYYYVNMAIAWLVSMIYIKYPNITLKYLNNNKLNDFTYNKTIQKIIESNKVSSQIKKDLRKLKR